MARDRASRPQATSRRLFVAVEVPPEAQRALDEAIAPWRSQLPEARWAPSENRHVTSKFLGAVRPQTFDHVLATVAEVAARAAPFEVRLAELGRFPARGKARVLWAGLEDPSRGLASLAELLDAALVPDFAPETRGYHPHLTLARSNPPSVVPPGWGTTVLDPVGWQVARLVLFESHLQRPHARYESIAAYGLPA